MWATRCCSSPGSLAWVRAALTSLSGSAQPLRAVRRFSAATLALEATLSTQLTDGWGVTNGLVEGELFVTDGSNKLYTLDAATLKTKVGSTHAVAPLLR